MAASPAGDGTDTPGAEAGSTQSRSTEIYIMDPAVRAFIIFTTLLTPSSTISSGFTIFNPAALAFSISSISARMGHVGISLPPRSKNSDSLDAILSTSGALLVPLRFACDLDSSGTPITTMSASSILFVLERWSRTTDSDHCSLLLTITHFDQ